MKPLVTTCFVILLGITLVACDQSIPTNPTTSDSSNVQSEIADTFTTPAVKAAVVSGEYRNRVYPLLVTTTDTSNEGDISTSDLNTSLSEVGEEADLGPPLPEDIPPPELKKLDPTICKKMAEVAGQLQGDGWWPSSWTDPGCGEEKKAVKRLNLPMAINLSKGHAEVVGTDILCKEDVGWFETNQCTAPYQELLFPALEDVVHGETPWTATLAHSHPPRPKGGQEIHDGVVKALKLDLLGPLFATGTEVRLSTFTVPEGKEWREAQLVIEHPLLGRWTGVLLLPLTDGEIRGGALAISGHEAQDMPVRTWLKGFAMTDYPKSGIAVLLMASRPYRAVNYPGVESFEPRLAYELWQRGNIPLMSLLVIEHMLEVEALRSILGDSQVPLALIGHSGGANVAQFLGVVAPDMRIVIADYPMIGEGLWHTKMPQTSGGLPPHCETTPGLGGEFQVAFNEERGSLPFQMLWASDPNTFGLDWGLPGGYWLPPKELALRKQVLLFSLGLGPMPVIPPPGG